MTFEEFLQANHPGVLGTYKSWEEHGWELEVGDWIETLQAGFSGYAGRRCQYIGFEEGDETWEGGHEFGYTDDKEASWSVSPDELFVKVKPIPAGELLEHEVEALERFRASRDLMSS